MKLYSQKEIINGDYPAPADGDWLRKQFIDSTEVVEGWEVVSPSKHEGDTGFVRPCTLKDWCKARWREVISGYQDDIYHGKEQRGYLPDRSYIRRVKK